MSTNDFLFAQLQPFTLAGAGAIVGATSIVLNSMQTIDGGDVDMNDFGLIGYGTIEPGNGELEEQISFSGITQNSNGTATLTGVKNVVMIYPYTEVSGLTKTHAGATTFVISNTSGFYNKLLAKDDDATITGLYTFPNGANTPVLGASYVAPTLNNQVASKGYADSLTFAGAPDATTTQKGIVELGVQAEIDAGTATGGTGASLVATPATTRSRLLSDYKADTGAANAYAIAPSPAVTALVAGMRFSFKVATTNTTTSTLVVNALSATAIFKKDGATALVAGDLVAGQIVEVEYNGINGFMLLTPTANTVSLTAGAYPAGNGAAITGLTGFPLVYLIVTGVSIVSSTAETTLFTTSIPGGTLSTGNALRFRMYFHTMELTDTKTATFRLKYGATTMVTFVLTYDGTAGQLIVGNGILEGYIFANASASAQKAFLLLLASAGATTIGNTTLSDVATTNIVAFATGTATEVSSGALNMVLTVQFNNSSTEDKITTDFTVVDKIQIS